MTKVSKSRLAKKHLKCPECELCFTRREHLNRHIRGHTGEKPFQCMICERAFKRSDGLKSHLKTHTKRIAKKTSHSVAYNAAADASVSIDREQPAIDNNVDIGNDENCENVDNDVTGESSDVVDSIYNDKATDVDEDSRTGSHQVELDRTSSPKGKSASGQYECDECERKFSRYEHFKRHVRGHSGEKPYQCMICERTFKRTDALRSHLRVHNVGVGAYKKQPVDETVVDKSSLVVGHGQNLDKIVDNSLTSADENGRHHQEIVKSPGGKEFSCSFCQKVFHYASHLTRHMTTHTDQKPFKCMLCDKLFARAERLMVHINTHFTDSTTENLDCQPSDSQLNRLTSI